MENTYTHFISQFSLSRESRLTFNTPSNAPNAGPEPVAEGDDVVDQADIDALHDKLDHITGILDGDEDAKKKAQETVDEANKEGSAKNIGSQEAPEESAEGTDDSNAEGEPGETGEEGNESEEGAPEVSEDVQRAIDGITGSLEEGGDKLTDAVDEFNKETENLTDEEKGKAQQVLNEALQKEGYKPTYQDGKLTEITKKNEQGNEDEDTEETGLEDLLKEGKVGAAILLILRTILDQLKGMRDDIKKIPDSLDGTEGSDAADEVKKRQQTLSALQGTNPMTDAIRARMAGLQTEINYLKGMDTKYRMYCTGPNRVCSNLALDRGRFVFVQPTPAFGARMARYPMRVQYTPGASRAYVPQKLTPQFVFNYNDNRTNNIDNSVNTVTASPNASMSRGGVRVGPSETNEANVASNGSAVVNNTEAAPAVQPNTAAQAPAVEPPQTNPAATPPQKPDTNVKNPGLFSRVYNGGKNLLFGKKSA